MSRCAKWPSKTFLPLLALAIVLTPVFISFFVILSPFLLVAAPALLCYCTAATAHTKPKPGPIELLMQPMPSTEQPVSEQPAAPAAPLTGGAAILARLRAQKAAAAAAPVAKPKALTVLYASQLGTAAEIAKNIATEAQSRGIESHLSSMNDFSFDKVTPTATPVVILVASSTGDGDAPDNAVSFYAAVRRKSNAADRLKGVQFTCLGLGDSNYTRFMAVPRSLRNRFLEMGATTFYAPKEADEVDGLEDVVESWIGDLWPALQKAVQPADAPAAVPAVIAQPAAMPLPPTTVKLRWIDGQAAEAVREQEAAGPKPEEVAFRDGSGMYSPGAPFWAPVAEAGLLTTPEAGDRVVIHLGLDISGSNMAYKPGDSIGVLPQNSTALVDDIIARLGVDGDAVFEVQPRQGADAAAKPLRHLHWPCSVRAALLRGCDLTAVPRKSLLRLLAEHCQEGAEKDRVMHLCSREGKEDYAADILASSPTLLDLLKQFPSCNPPLDALLEALPPLPPRMYSITCSPGEAPHRVEVAFTVVKYQAGGKEREGVATTWLHRLCAPLLATPSCAVNGTAAVADGELARPRVPVFLRHGGDFRAPEDLSVPWVLIGPGTGVAPFRGFLQERRRRLAAGPASGAAPCWLYYGCRRADHDFLYEDDLKAFEADGTLTKLEVAFSRAQDEKVYVQHLMARAAHDLYGMIVVQRGYVFVCGDGAAMAKDVHAALVDILVKEGGMGEDAAKEALTAMAQEGRYVRDIWS